MSFKIGFTSDSIPVVPYAGDHFLSDQNFEFAFSSCHYGDSIAEIFLVFMGRVEQHRQRRSIQKADLTHYLDIMLPVFPILFSPVEGRIRLMGVCMREQLAASLRKYGFKPEQFDTERFIADLDGWLDRTRMLKLMPEEAAPYELLKANAELSDHPTSILRSFGVQHDSQGRILSTIDEVNWTDVRRWRAKYNNKLWQEHPPHYPGWPDNMPITGPSEPESEQSESESDEGNSLIFADIPVAIPIIANAGSQFTTENNLLDAFMNKDYGDAIICIQLTILGEIENNPSSVRFERKNQMLYAVIQLPVLPMIFATVAERIRMYGICIREQLIPILRKYKFASSEFDTERFIVDFDAWLEKTRMLTLTEEEAAPYALLTPGQRKSIEFFNVLDAIGVRYDGEGNVLSTPDELLWKIIDSTRNSRSHPKLRNKQPYYPGWPEPWPQEFLSPDMRIS